MFNDRLVKLSLYIHDTEEFLAIKRHQRRGNENGKSRNEPSPNVAEEDGGVKASCETE